MFLKAAQKIRMNAEEEQMKKRLRELAERSYRGNCYTFTDFLSPAELSCYYELERELSFAGAKVSGGSEGRERCMIRFGNPEELGYEEDFPIVCLKIEPLMKKFAEDLTHRDFLGALMNLGIERSTLGDIILQEKDAFLFCKEAIAPYIMENLTRVKHTSVLCRMTEELPGEAEADLKDIKIQIASERIDGVVAKVYKLSRSDSADLFLQKRVFVNGRLCENNSHMLKEQDQISIRGFGKFIFAGGCGVSKKGKLNVLIQIYGG